jgi:nicotinamide riboside transporter PnuC
MKIKYLLFFYNLKENFLKNALGWIGASLVLFGYVLNAQKMPISWLIWVVGNAMVGTYCLQKKTYPTAVMSFILVILNVYGYLCWIKWF